MTIRSHMSFIIVIIGLEHLELFVLESRKIAELDFVYILSSNINQSVPDLVKMNTTIRSRMRSIMEVIRPDLSKLSDLELENLPYLTLFPLKHLQI